MNDTYLGEVAKNLHDEHFREGVSIQQMADILGCNSAHISNVIAGKRKPGPTLIRAMIKAGWIDPPPPYEYFKIRRDEPRIAAKQILQTLGRGYASNLLWELAMIHPNWLLKTRLVPAEDKRISVKESLDMATQATKELSAAFAKLDDNDEEE